MPIQLQQVGYFGFDLTVDFGQWRLFAEVWGLPRFDAQPVTRAEFHLRRPILKTIKSDETSETGIDTFADLCESF